MITASSSIDCATEAVKYLAGYVAFRFKAQYPDLASDGSTDPPVACPWIDAYSYGGLSKPSASWLEQYQRLEGEFHNVHGLKISREPGVVHKLEAHLQAAFPSVPSDLIKFYAKMRTHIRIKYLRIMYKTATEETRSQKKLKHFKN